ncbi:MAG: MBL fold metallo-hydrolase [Myxococcota bacterium]
MRLAVLGGVLGLALVVVAAIALSIYRTHPPEAPEQAKAVPPVYPVNSGGVIVYLVAPAGEPVVLINSGADPEASAILAQLSALGRTPEDVVAIVLNHGSYDHWAGHSHFPNATVYGARTDLELVDHARRIESKTPRMHMRLFGRPPKPHALRSVVASQLLRFGTLEFDCIPVPGVTQGTMAYRWQDFLFVGDTLWRDEDRLSPPPSNWLERRTDLPVILKRLDRHPTPWLATSRHGLLPRDVD